MRVAPQILHHMRWILKRRFAISYPFHKDATVQQGLLQVQPYGQQRTMEPVVLQQIPPQLNPRAQTWELHRNWQAIILYMLIKFTRKSTVPCRYKMLPKHSNLLKQRNNSSFKSIV
ncbi:hypothetical protein N007_15680 [Alicyclobacillus acidoterrestris ATCC 49025]|nr:hypothetical protein N007_15680 [Alicyclobacillus acidoterrestris ATCC 49025]